MDYLHAINVSASGMDFQRLRLEIIATNLANANSSRSVNGHLFKPLEAVATSSGVQKGLGDFNGVLQNELHGIENVEVLEKDVAPRMVYDPNHPDANEDGFVSLPNIDLTNTMVDMLSATRSYEANVKVIAAARAMALRALEIGE